MEIGFQILPVWSPLVSQPRPSYTSPSSPIRKLCGWRGGEGVDLMSKGGPPPPFLPCPMLLTHNSPQHLPLLLKSNASRPCHILGTTLHTHSHP